MTPMPGLHHVTAISGPPQENLDFYTRVLKQRLVKRTVNFDDPGTYHLYYGDHDATPGTILTFFPFVDAGPGRAGPGMASALAYRVAPGRLDAIVEHFADAAIDCETVSERFGERMVALTDPDRLRIELIEAAEPSAVAGDIGAFHSVTLWVERPERTARVLTDVFGMVEAGHSTSPTEERWRFRAPDGLTAAVDVVRSDAAAIGRQGAGTVHHVAFRARTNEEQLDWRERVQSAGLNVTPVIDRQYFNAIYFREPGGILFEIATDPPGFAVDEPMETLGHDLKLPPQYEAMRERIERVLPPLKVAA
jgi:glyoxalase family protein